MFGIRLVAHVVRVDDPIGFSAATKEDGSNHDDHWDDYKEREGEGIAVFTELEILNLTEGVVA